MRLTAGGTTAFALFAFLALVVGFALPSGPLPALFFLEQPRGRPSIKIARGVP